MSSISIDGSGSRALSLTVNDQQRTHAQMPSRTDDNVNVQVTARETRVIIPLGSRLERIKSGNTEMLRLVVPGGISVFGDSEEKEGTAVTWPHVFVYAGKHLEDHYGKAEVVEVVHERLGDLIPPTE